MSDNKIIKLKDVEETLMIPLYARKLSTELFPFLYEDKYSTELVDKIDYDFSKLESKSGSFMQKFGALQVAMRQMGTQFEVLDYLEKNPKASVVSLGCGLDHIAESCDNGLCKIYNIDFEDVIFLRSKLFSSNERIKNIDADLNDMSWFDLIDKDNGVVMYATGVFYYFKEEEIRKLFTSMENRFKGSVLVFDTAGEKAVKMMNKTWIKQAGIDEMVSFFYVDDADDLRKWLKDTEISSRGYMLGYNDLKDDRISPILRFMSKFCDKFFKMKIIKLYFK
ncbi:MAG: class I SAM-dependent methyltransferase [Tissierellia bacterium]|nr:class I SAM-dependent methyltransferase [Tissierellia bacterium]